MRDRREKFLSVGNLRFRKDINRSSRLNHVTVLHDKYMISHVGHDTHVVGDENDSCSQTLVEGTQQIQDLRLNGHIERGCWLIRNEYLRVTRDRLSNHRALSLTAGQLVGIRIEGLLGVRQIDETQ